MRHLFQWVLAGSLLGMMLGCHHTAGVCDCELQGHDEQAGAVIMNPEPPLIHQNSIRSTSQDPGK